MKRVLAILVLLGPLLGCQGADELVRPDPGCFFSENDFEEKNGPCEPCEGLQSGPESRDKNKPCIPEESTAAPGGR